MAAVVEMSNESKAVDDIKIHGENDSVDDKKNPNSESKPESDFNVQKLVDMFRKLNPSAEAFFPSYYNQKNHQQAKNQLLPGNNILIANEQPGGGIFSNNRRRKNGYSQGKRFNRRVFKAQREDSIRRTVYVSDIDQNVTEEHLAGLFSTCGQVVDCRICGDARTVLHFAFVEFVDEQGARAALSLGGTMLGYYPIKVLPSKTAILPVNPTFLPRSENEREMCSRTVYCTNIDKKVSEADVKSFFESACGKVTRLRLLGDQMHSTRIAFVEFAMAESAVVALNCSGMVLGTHLIRVSPSKTPVKPADNPRSG